MPIKEVIAKIVKMLRNNNKDRLFPKIGIPFLNIIKGITNIIGILRNNIISIKGTLGINFINIARTAKQMAAKTIIKIPCTFTLLLTSFIGID